MDIATALILYFVIVAIGLWIFFKFGQWAGLSKGETFIGLILLVLFLPLGILYFILAIIFRRGKKTEKTSV